MTVLPVSSFLKRSILFGTILALSAVSSAQNYYQGIGAQLDYGSYNILYTNSLGTFTERSATIIPGGVYKGTYSITDNDFLNIAGSIYPFLGLNVSSSTQWGSSYSIGFEIPLDFEIYLGDMEEGCFFFGAGFTFGFLSSNYFGGGPIIGPQADVGFQFPLAGRITGVRVAWTTGINSSKTDDPTITILSDKKNMLSVGGYYLF